MWVGALSEDDTELMNHLSSELAYFSRKGDLGRTDPGLPEASILGEFG